MTIVDAKIHPALMGSLSPNVTVDEVINFSPGPTSLPAAVEKAIADGFQTPGLTSLALSHRSPEFLAILNHAAASVRSPRYSSPGTTHDGKIERFAALDESLFAQRKG